MSRRGRARYAAAMSRMISAFVSARLAVFGALAVLGMGRSCTTVTPPVSDQVGLAAALSDAARVSVDPRNVAWEPSRGVLLDVFFGRRVLFLGRSHDEPHDLYRATFRITPEGKLIRPTRVVRLTQTPLADERGLTGEGQHAALASVAFGRVASVSLLDLANTAGAPAGWLERGVLAVRRWTEQGSFAGLGLTHLALDQPKVELSVSGGALQLQGASGQRVAADLAAGTLRDPAGVVHAAWREPLAPSRYDRASGWVDTAVSRLGVARLLGAVQATPTLPEPAPAAAVAAWPPAPIAPFVAGEPQDGRWQQVSADGTIYRTALNLDPAGASRLELVSFDSRRLQLRLEGGYAWPKPQAGPPGIGRVPDRVTQVVATFNGVGDAPSTGMMVERRVASPASAGLPSVVLTEQGQVGLGPWPAGAPAEGIVSYRQASTALVVEGHPAIVEPRGPLATRSALCLSAGGGLVYAWTAAASRAVLALGLSRAGCRYAIELSGVDTGFATVSGEGRERAATKLVGGPDFSPATHLLGSASDFFYLVERGSKPRAAKYDWSISPGVQPEPTDVPALLSARTRVGDLDVELFSVELQRVAWSVVGGGSEPLFAGKAAPPRALSGDEQERALFAMDLGHTTRATRYGLAFGKRDTLGLRSPFATLVLSPAGAELLPAGTLPEQQADGQYVQLPELMRDGQLLGRASQPGARRMRGALCVRADGRLLAAFVVHDSSAPLALQLLDAGCDAALELDRGSQHPALLYRAGTSLVVPTSSETTLLVGLAKAMPQTAFLFGEALDQDAR